jgi:flagellin
MRINTNVSALNTFRNLTSTENAVSSSMQKLSSGFRINRASDDAAGLAIANKLRNTGKSLEAASRNAQQAGSMLQIADGAGQSIASILDRMKELATQAASNTIGDQAGKLDDEFQALNNEIQRIVDTTKYQGTALLTGTGAGSVKVDDASTVYDGGSDVTKVTLSSSAASGKTWTIANAAADNNLVSITDGTDTYYAVAKDGAQTISFAEAGVSIETSASFKISDGTDPGSFDGKTVITAAGTASGTPLTILVGATGDPSGTDKLDLALPALAKLSGDLTSISNAQTAMGSVDTLLNTVNSFLGNVGALQSRLDFASQNLATTIQNTAAAESAIRDVDMAQEMTTFSKNQILQQAGTAMLAQANQLGQGVLTLLRG